MEKAVETIRILAEEILDEIATLQAVERGRGNEDQTDKHSDRAGFTPCAGGRASAERTKESDRKMAIQKHQSDKHQNTKANGRTVQNAMRKKRYHKACCPQKLHRNGRCFAKIVTE